MDATGRDTAARLEVYQEKDKSGRAPSCVVFHEEATKGRMRLHSGLLQALPVTQVRRALNVVQHATGPRAHLSAAACVHCELSTCALHSTRSVTLESIKCSWRHPRVWRSFVCTP